MRKLNNKGMTIIEVLVCFVIVSVVMMSLFSTISAFNEKRIQESYRAKLYSFKNEWTSKIQEDFIKKGLSFAKISKEYGPGGVTYVVDCTLKTGEKRQLRVYQRYTLTSKKIDGNGTINDRFYLEYGDPEKALYHEELPDLGRTNWVCEDDDGTINISKCKIGKTKNDSAWCTNPDTGSSVKEPCFSYDFQINNVEINITNEAEQSSTDHVLNIYIGFYHPNFGTKYGIDVICPIDYQGSNSDTSTYFNRTDQYNDRYKSLLIIPDDDPKATPSPSPTTGP